MSTSEVSAGWHSSTVPAAKSNRSQRLRSFIENQKLNMRKSVLIRVVTMVATIGGVLLVIVGMILTWQVRDRVFADRLEQVLIDADVRSREAQASLKASVAQTPAQVQGIANELIASFPNGVSGLTGAILMAAPDETDIKILEPWTSTTVALRPLVSEEIRQAVRKSDNQYWQSVKLDLPEGSAPGIMVGTMVNLPLAGPQELYLVYSLAQEQKTVNVVVSVLSAGFVLLTLLEIIIVWLVINYVLRPVKQVSDTARKFAQGNLFERAHVYGEDELAVLASSFNQMAESLENQIEQMEELSKVQQRFVSDVSHELRTPMTTIRMAADMIEAQREFLPPAQQRATEMLMSQLDRFEAMLADLLEISRFDLHSAQLNVEVVEIGLVVHSVVELSSVLAEQQNVPLILQPPDEEVSCLGDRVRIERIIRNLVVNAIEHAEGKPVEIAWAQGSALVQIRVTDHGVGLSEEQALHVFDRFWRADPARARTTGGTGLGLAISLEDAALHGGTLEVHGILGVGSAFLLTLPTVPGGPLSDGPLAPIPDDLLAASLAAELPSEMPNEQEVLSFPGLPESETSQNLPDFIEIERSLARVDNDDVGINENAGLPEEEK